MVLIYTTVTNVVINCTQVIGNSCVAVVTCIAILHLWLVDLIKMEMLLCATFLLWAYLTSDWPVVSVM